MPDDRLEIIEDQDWTLIAAIATREMARLWHKGSSPASTGERQASLRDWRRSVAEVSDLRPLQQAAIAMTVALAIATTMAPTK